MGRGDYLGEFEQVVLLAVARLEDEAYGMRVREEIEARAGRRTSIGAVYATLARLVSKGDVRETEMPGGAALRRSSIWAGTSAGLFVCCAASLDSPPPRSSPWRSARG